MYLIYVTDDFTITLAMHLLGKVLLFLLKDGRGRPRSPKIFSHSVYLGKVTKQRTESVPVYYPSP